MNVEVLVAAMNQQDILLHNKMNLKCPVTIANQCGKWNYEETEYEYGVVKMISTATKGVGVNRNIAISVAGEEILLFADDDMFYYDSNLTPVVQAFMDNPKADIIFFGLDMTKNGEVYRKCHYSHKRIHIWNSLKFGTARMAIRKSALDRHALSFSTLFGGGAMYSCGEDSLFIVEAIRKGLKAYSHPYVMGKCAKDSSSWFTGFNEKFLYDKGAWIAAAFPKSKYIILFYFLLRFCKRTGFSIKKTFLLLIKGIRGFKSLSPYTDSIYYN